MVEINLLPEETKKSKRSAPKIDVSKIDIKGLSLVNIALIIIGGLAAIQIFLFGMGVLFGSYFSISNKEYKTVLPRKIEAEKLKSQIERMSRKVSAINELMVKRFSWAKKLDDLSDSMTPGIWLTGLEYEEKLGEKPGEVKQEMPRNKGVAKKQSVEKVVLKYLIISGAATNTAEEGTALIGRFIKSLKSNENFYSDFSDIELGNIKREKIDDQEIMTFNITCLYKIR